jgi:hypothetical protein
MLTQRFWAIFAIYIVIVPVFSGTGSAQTLVMPIDLVEFARANGCSQIDDFFGPQSPGKNPPYVYGWIPGTDESSAVFWCKKDEKSDKPYKLIFKARDPKQLGCPAVSRGRVRAILAARADQRPGYKRKK